MSYSNVLKLLTYHLQNGQRLAKHLSFSQMPWSEFVRYFTDVSVCQLLTMGTLTEGKQYPKNNQQQQKEGAAQRGMSMRLKASRRSNATMGLTEQRWREWVGEGREREGREGGCDLEVGLDSSWFPLVFGRAYGKTRQFNGTIAEH